MGDRQDIDALLIGALYGELTPADEARLTAHLESHPADKTALDDLKTARSRVKESRIFELQTEPPQAISAVLLQEAARRAPRRAATSEPRESWFHRFVRSFAAHPAMAAAATLVLVIGVAGTLYVHDGDVGYAEKTAAAPSQSAGDQAHDEANVPPSAPGGPVAPQAPAAAADNAAGAVAQGSGYDVGLAEQRQQLVRKEAEISGNVLGSEAGKDQRARVVDEPKPSAEPSDSYASKQAVAHASSKKKGNGYLEVTTPQRMPKEMTDDKDADGIVATAPNASGGAVGGGGAPAGPATAATATPQAPPPPPSVYKNAPATKPSPAKTVAKAPAPAPQQEAPVEAQQGDSTLIAWAKQQHQLAKARVRAGDCSGAAQLAVAVRNRASGYYQQNMQNDRDLKGCASYIADAVNRDEERGSKSKAAKAATDESPAPSVK